MPTMALVVLGKLNRPPVLLFIYKWMSYKLHFIVFRSCSLWFEVHSQCFVFLLPHSLTYKLCLVYVTRINLNIQHKFFALGWSVFSLDVYLFVFR